MTEQVLSTPAASQEASAGVAQDSSVSHYSAPEVSQPAVSEKLIPQSEVGRIAGASRKEGHDKGYEKGYQEALSKQQQQQAANSVPATPTQTQNFQPRTADEIQELVSKAVAESFKRNQDEQLRLQEDKRINDYYTQVANQLKPKIESAKAKYEDFEAKMQDLHIDKAPQIIELVNSVQNAGDVLYDLANNPHKLGILKSLEYAPELALREVQRISQSLQNNESAQNKPTPKNPLTTIEPSTVGKQSGELSGQQLTDQARQKYRF